MDINLLIKVYPDADPKRTSQIYAGLCDLHSKGKINLSWLNRCPRELESVYQLRPNVLWMEVEDPNNEIKFKVCFDVADQGYIIALERLNECDIYIKRSFSQSYVNNLSDDIRKKVIPYGLHYSCRLPNEKGRLRRWLIYLKSQNKFSKRPIHLLTKVLKSFISHKPLLTNEYEVPPNEPAESKILFQTRLWSHQSQKKHKKLDEMRVDTIKALKSSFGKRFIGGLIPSKFTKEKYHDCISKYGTSRLEFQDLIRKCLITVTTTGLHGSIGWKLPEYLAASRCIVTEPLVYELPNPLLEGKNIITFKTPEECVEACNNLLNNDSFAYQMRVNNYQYYKDHVQPAAIIENSLKSARRRYMTNMI